MTIGAYCPSTGVAAAPIVATDAQSTLMTQIPMSTIRATGANIQRTSSTGAIAADSRQPIGGVMGWHRGEPSI